MKDRMVRVSPGTHRRLELLGAKGESFDHVITRLIVNYTTTHPHAAQLLEENHDDIESIRRQTRGVWIHEEFKEEPPQ